LTRTAEQQTATEIEPHERALVISSDGHAMAEMDEYRQYLPARLHDDFDAFLTVYREHGARNTDTVHIELLKGPDEAKKWARDVVEPGHLDGISDSTARIRQQDRNGLAAEILFPDFGLPFEIGGPSRANLLGYTRTAEQISAGNQAHNRWLVDFCSVAPHRFAAMACVSFDDVDAAVREIRWAKDAGFKGVLLPTFDEEVPVYDPRFDPIWQTVEELEMPLNSHAGSSATTHNIHVARSSLPYATNTIPMYTQQLFFFCHQLLHHLIWGGVLERYPTMRVVFTEQGSGWVPGHLESMDYTYEGSYLTHEDLREVVRLKPSEYFERQCSLGSSIFSLAEVQARHRIGVHKMALGMDYPHHEGAWAAGPGTSDYLRATLGVAGVDVDEARLMLGENAAAVWNLDLAQLKPLAQQIGTPLTEILTPPAADYYPRGDVKKPVGTV
jgi:predicted TIM-barrel fold metal-dependent hydrolase